MIDRDTFNSDESYKRYMDLQNKINETQKKIDNLKPWKFWELVDKILDMLDALFHN